jgi:hypothetical protein
MADPTFDSTTLENASIQGIPDYSNQSFKVIMRCITTTDATTNLDALVAKKGVIVTRRVSVDGYVSLQGTGTVGSLVIGAKTYTNCMISELTVTPTDRKATHYEYFVTFERHTAG